MTLSYPFIWNFTQPNTTIEIFVDSGDVSYGVYKAYLMIEEFEKQQFTIGRDRITDQTNVTKV